MRPVGQQRNPMRHVITRLACMLFGFACLDAAAQISVLVERGESHLEARQYEQAATLFCEARQDAESLGDAEWIGRCDFYLGLTRQQQASNADAADLHRFLVEAKEHYSAAQIRLPSAATFNNLGEVLLLLGEPEAAVASFEAAVALKDPNRSLYATNLADALRAQGDYSQAVRHYRDAVQANPLNVDAHRALVAVYRERPVFDPLSYVAQLQRQGLFSLAGEAALDIAAHGRNNKFDRFGLITLAMRSFAEEGDPRSFRKSPAFAELSRMKSVKYAMDEIVQLFDSPGQLVEGAAYWKQPQFYPAGESQVDGAAMFRALARALGRQAEAATLFKDAETYYWIASNSHPDGAEPAALAALAALYFRQGRGGDIDEIARRYEPRKFDKDTSPADPLFRANYEFHRSLGVLYDSAQRWTNADVPKASALFHLGRAETLRQSIIKTWDPGMAALLSKAFLAAKDVAKSFHFVLDAAEGYVSEGSMEDAKDLLSIYLDHGTPSVAAIDDRERFLKLVRFWSKPTPPAVLERRPQPRRTEAVRRTPLPVARERVAAGPVPTEVKRVVLIVLEERPQAIPRSQFLKFLETRGASLSRYFGVADASQPNHIALISGSLRNAMTTDPVSLDRPHLGRILGDRWKVYAEDYPELPGRCNLVSSNKAYVRRRVPFLSFIDVQQGTCEQIVALGTAREPMAALIRDVRSGKLPDFVLIVPNLEHSDVSATSDADRWLMTNIRPLLMDSQLLSESVIIVTFARSTASRFNGVHAFIVGDRVLRGVRKNTANHFDLFLTIAALLKVKPPQLDDPEARPINWIWVK